MQTVQQQREYAFHWKFVAERIEFQPYILWYHVFLSAFYVCLGVCVSFHTVFFLLPSQQISLTVIDIMVQTAMKIFQLILFHFYGNKTFVIFLFSLFFHPVCKCQLFHLIKNEFCVMKLMEEKHLHKCASKCADIMNERAREKISFFLFSIMLWSVHIILPRFYSVH